MPETDKFMSDERGNGFPFCPAKVDVSDRFDGQPYDYWTTLGGWSKVDEPASDALKAESIAKSLENAMKLFWNYNGHTVDYDGGLRTLTIDIEQGDFDSLSGGTAPFEPKDRVCTNGWDVDRVEDPEFGDRYIWTDISPIRMYNGPTDDEDNFVGYGMDSGEPAFLANDIDEFFFSSYLNEDENDTEAYEYSEAIEDGMWFVAAAEGGFVDDMTPTINGLSADFFTDEGVLALTITYKDFDFYTYPT